MKQQFILLSVTLAFSTAHATCTDPLASIGTAEESRFRIEVCQLTNNYRISSGLGTLDTDPRLSQMAQYYAQDMLSRRFFGHTDPDGRNFTIRIRQWRVHYGWAGENIATGYPDSHHVLYGWMNSSGHRANILNGRFRKIGVGYAGRYWVQVFTD